MYSNSKWTTLATVGREIIEDADGVSIKIQFH